MGYQHIVVPDEGEKITVNGDGNLNVPDRPIIPFIEGDGIGIDISPVMIKVVDEAVQKSYDGQRSISWMEVYAGEKSVELYGEDEWLPAETVDAMREFVVGIKGPMTTPVGGGIRSLNVALRQVLDLYVCQRPVRWLKGVPSPVKAPEKTDMTIFRENTEDIYAGIEWEADSAQASKVISFLHDEMDVHKIRFPGTLRHRHQADFRGRHPAPRAQGAAVCDRRRSRLRDLRSQGQHHEIHRGCLQGLGL